MSVRPDRPPARLAEGGEPVSRLLAGFGDPAPPSGLEDELWPRLRAARAPHAGTRLRVALGACAALLAAWVAYGALEPRATAPAWTVTLASGDVHRAGLGAIWTSARLGEHLRSGDRLATGPEGRASIDSSGVRLRLEPAARIAFLGGVVMLEAGEISAEARQAPFAIGAAPFELRGESAVLRVQVAADSAVSFEVQEGRVHLRGRSIDRVFAAGERWSSGSAESSSPPGPRQAELAVASPSRPVRAVEPAHPARARTGASSPLLPEASSNSVLPDGRADSDVRRSSLAKLSSRRDPGLPSAAPDPILGLVEEVAALPAGEERDALTYRLAGLYTRAGRYREAVVRYEALAGRAGNYAELSLYEVGRLEVRFLSEPARATAAFLDYRRRFPKGALLPEVDLSLIEIRLRAGAIEEAISEMTAFLGAHPRSERREDVVLLRANARRDLGDCALALIDYRALLAEPGRSVEEALFHSAFCERRLGQLEAAREHLSRYLLQFPHGRYRVEAHEALDGGR